MSETESDITLLTIGQHLTSLVAGNLHPSYDYDLLLVGSQTNLLAYDVEKNTELFYKDVRPSDIVVCVHYVMLNSSYQTEPMP